MQAVFARWWTGDALGVLIVGSLILAWLTQEASPVRLRYALFEGSLLAVLTCLVTWLAFWRWSPELAYLAMTMHASTAQLALAKAGLTEDSPAARAVARLRTLTAGALAEMRH